MSPGDVPDTTYVLFHDEVEKKRLQRQHLMFERFFGRDANIIPSPIIHENVTNVLDVAAGTLVWSTHLASMPEIAPRLSPSSPKPVHIYACDLTAEKFPPKSVTDTLGIRTFEHDVTKPFPEEMKGKFDIVNMKMLILALSERGWEKALINIRQVLKPGGALLLREVNGYYYAKEEEVPGAESLVSDKSWTYPVNRLFKKDADLNHHLRDLALRLPELVKSTGYSIASQTSAKLPIGATCETCPSAFGQSLETEVEISGDIFTTLLTVLSSFALKEGYLEGPEGPITTEAGRRGLIRNMRERVLTEGVFVYGTELVAVRKD